MTRWSKLAFLGEAYLLDGGLGATQWYVLYHLGHDGPTMQRELLQMLKVERATLSVVVGELVRKGLVKQVPDRVDGRQKLLRITEAGAALLNKLPDLETLIQKAAFNGIDDADIANRCSGASHCYRAPYYSLNGRN